MRTIDELIAEAPTFAGLESGQLEFIAGCARNEHFDAGSMLMREGDPADRFFLIRRGMIALEIESPGRGTLIVQTLEPGEVVGWSWLFAPYRWAMDARAVESTSVIVFDGGCLRGKCEQDHELGYQLMSRFTANVIDRLQSTRLQLLDVYGSAPSSG
ncbi:MAG: cyclic nucleotide-binding domain-containing protein [Solirubrobacteraceae bacterium]|jgi:CRP-like cAMP-binding protein